MKKFCLMLLLIGCLTSPAYGWWTVGTGGTTGVTGFCDCSGDVNWCWEVTADNVDITASGGCADAGWDTTGTANSTVSLEVAPSGKTGYAIYSPTSEDYITFLLPEGLADTWTIQFDVNFHVVEDLAKLFNFQGNVTTDYIRIQYVAATDDMRVSWVGQSSGAVQASTTVNIAEDTWYTIIVKVRVGASDPSVYIDADGGSSGTSDTDLTAWGTESSLFRIGGESAAGGHYIKNIKIWNSWQ